MATEPPPDIDHTREPVFRSLMVCEGTPQGPRESGSTATVDRHSDNSSRISGWVASSVSRARFWGPRRDGLRLGQRVSRKAASPPLYVGEPQDPPGKLGRTALVAGLGLHGTHESRGTLEAPDCLRSPLVRWSWRDVAVSGEDQAAGHLHPRCPIPDGLDVECDSPTRASSERSEDGTWIMVEGMLL